VKNNIRPAARSSSSEYSMAVVIQSRLFLIAQRIYRAIDIRNEVNKINAQRSKE
jgi:uncharacterized membrane protein